MICFVRGGTAQLNSSVEMSGNSTNGTHHRPYKTCKEVSDLCPVELTTLGYYPNVGINVFFAIGFGIALIAVLVTGIWKKTWSYMGFIAAGCILELAGT